MSFLSARRGFKVKLFDKKDALAAVFHFEK